MVKVDYSRDYYGDLELQPSADSSEIKKQYMKLARKYHPDRNIGRETEVTAAFQVVQSAYEVLLDSTERAKYDANRRTAPQGFRSGGYGGASGSGVRGNPWATAGSQWAPPPKAPTARKAPPQSAGARRYEKWDTPKASTNWSGYEGPDARTKQYEAWENMRGHTTTKPGPGRTWGAPKVPPRETPKSGREESNSKTHAPPPKARPGYDEFQNGPSSTTPKRSQSTSAKKGFMPNTPGGDEPAAPRGAYFTQRAAPPDPPPRQPPPRSPTLPPRENVAPDPLKQFRDQGPQFEPRLSTPYATRGGEKLNPNGSANVNRSKSTREPGSKQVPRTGSDPSLSSPHRARSYADRSSARNGKSYNRRQVDHDTSSSEDEPRMNGPFGKPKYASKPTNGASTGSAQPQAPPNANQASTNPRKPTSNLGKFRQWMKENPGAEPPLNGFPPDGPPLRSDSTYNDKDDEAKMYAKSENISFPHPSSFSVKLPTFADRCSSKDTKATTQSSEYVFTPQKFPSPFHNGTRPTIPPSGVAADPKSLNAFEDIQRNIINQLLSSKNDKSCSGHKHRIVSDHAKTQNGNHAQQQAGGEVYEQPSKWNMYRDPSDNGSPSKKMKPLKHLHAVHTNPSSQSRGFWQNLQQLKADANQLNRPSRFSFNVDNDTFKRTNSNGFTSHSAENISTKFTPEDWTGKFEAGADYFKPEPKASGVPPRGRAQSGSRSRGRSPIKVRPVDPQFGAPSQFGAPPPVPEKVLEMPIESPGGTTFSAAEWEKIFKPQTFAPPVIPPRPSPGRRATRGSTARPTMGTAAVVDESETSDETPFKGKAAAAAARMPASPDAMDVDTPPATNTVPVFTTEGLNVNTEKHKRPAAPSATQSPVDTEELKVGFDDLKLKDIISSLELPSPPKIPTAPQQPSPYERYTAASYEEFKKEFRTYMSEQNQVDGFGEKKTEDDKILEKYRQGQKEDTAVINHWQEARGVHEKVMKEYAIIRERMKTREEREGTAAQEENGVPRPRKKTH
ncbi:hypothetical protein B0J14DRAFT_666603 [Halenospora varia]|nr:hypothetical protein B0J14DRAFT_666603 [Halenospora varia]